MKLLCSFSFSLLFLSTLTGKTVQFGAWDEALPQKLQGARAEIVTGVKREIPLYAIESPSLTVEEDKTTQIWVRQDPPAAEQIAIIEEPPTEDIAVIEEQPTPPVQEIWVRQDPPAAEEIAVIEEPLAPPVEEIPATEPSPYVIEESPPAPAEEVIVIQKHESSWRPANPLRPACREKFSAPIEIPYESDLTEAPPVLNEPCCDEVCLPCPKRECCSPYLGYGAGAAVIGTAIAGMLIPDCKTDPDPNGPPPPPPLPQTLQFNIRYLCEEIAGTPLAEIVLPSMAIFQTYGIGVGENPSNIINGPTAGTYNINVNGIDNPESCFVIDVIADGVTVISGASFSGTAPNITFVYNLP